MDDLSWPPDYVNTPIDALLDDEMPHAVLRFYLKLKALAWRNNGQYLSAEVDKIRAMTGLVRSQFYSYLALLRDLGRLLFAPTDKGVLRIDFAGSPKFSDSPKISDKAVFNTSIDSLTSKLNGTSNSKVINQHGPKISDSPKKSDTPAKSATREITDAYCELLGYKPDNWAEGESSAAKRIAEKWTVSQFREAYEHFKAEPFWKSKRLTLRHLVNQMPDYFLSKAKAEEFQGTVYQ